jgi:3-oxoacyl-[acyl-carrier protein] reductase
LNLSDVKSVQTAVKELRKEVAFIDIVILCAGHNQVTPIEDIKTEEWRTILDINLTGAFFLVQAVRPILRPDGAIVAVSSVAAYTGAPHHAHYAAAKAGLENLTKSLARELAPDIRVNCVAPGITLTPMGMDTAANLPPDYAQEKLLLRRFADPEEIARCIVFLASPAASFVTGASLDVNGGRYLR